jgi:predicted aldo/keto reductase-like oxidoreductase
MERRRLGKAGPEVGVIGLGTEHIQRTGDTLDGILRAAVEVGASYVDLLYVEPDYWEAFGSVYRAYRDRLVLAAHWGGGAVYDQDYCRSTFANMLSQVGNHYIDVAMMTMIDDGGRKGQPWREASLEHLHRLQQQGHLGLVGGSAHDPAVALEAVRGGWLDVLMFPVSMLGHDYEPDRTLRQACLDHGVGLVAMKPYHGGRLFSANGQPTGITPAQCLDYVFSLPVATAVPGPRTLAEWQATLHYLEATEEEKDYRPVLTTLHDRLVGQCVYCHHCLPCPQGIEIGWTIWCVDNVPGGDLDMLRREYAGYPARASECVECGICLERCPFEVDIMARLREAVEIFEDTAV